MIAIHHCANSRRWRVVTLKSVFLFVLKPSLLKVVRLTRPLWEMFCAGTAPATPNTGRGLLTHEARYTLQYTLYTYTVYTYTVYTVYLTLELVLYTEQCKV